MPYTNDCLQDVVSAQKIVCYAHDGIDNQIGHGAFQVRSARMDDEVPTALTDTTGCTGRITRWNIVRAWATRTTSSSTLGM